MYLRCVNYSRNSSSPRVFETGLVHKLHTPDAKASQKRKQVEMTHNLSGQLPVINIEPRSGRESGDIRQ